jgi:hypothetical protein
MLAMRDAGDICEVLLLNKNAKVEANVENMEPESEQLEGKSLYVWLPFLWFTVIRALMSEIWFGSTSLFVGYLISTTLLVLKPSNRRGMVATDVI